jgi:hypothetical protein
VKAARNHTPVVGTFPLASRCGGAIVAVVDMGGAKAASTTNEQRGPVLDVLRDLLERGQLDAVLELVAKLVARNSELERKLGELRSSRRTNEGVSSAQLALLLEAL